MASEWYKSLFGRYAFTSRLRPICSNVVNSVVCVGFVLNLLVFVSASVGYVLNSVELWEWS